MPLPNLVIGGAAKAGTTSLFHYLAQHPEVCPSSVKETRYFSPLRFGDGELAPVEEYAAYFAAWKGERYRMEATPGYLYGGERVIDAMERLLDEPRVVFILRDPVERVLPSYRYLKSRLAVGSDLTFDQYLEECLRARDEGRDLAREENTYFTVTAGQYADYLGVWLERFGDRTRVVFFDDLRDDPRALVRGLCEWLAIDPGAADGFDYTISNKTVLYRNALLQKAALAVNRAGILDRQRRLKAKLRSAYYALNGREDTQKLPLTAKTRLEDLYRPYNERLAALLTAHGYGRLPQWLTSPAAPAQPSEVTTS